MVQYFFYINILYTFFSIIDRFDVIIIINYIFGYLVTVQVKVFAAVRTAPHGLQTFCVLTLQNAVKAPIASIL